MRRALGSLACLGCLVVLTSCADSDFGKNMSGILSGIEVPEVFGNGNQNAAVSDQQSVAGVQAMLNQLGYRAGQEDGQYGSQTASAIRQFQRTKGMPADGRMTTSLVAALQEEVAANGRSADVAQAQSSDVKNAAILGAVGGAIAGTALNKKLGVSNTAGAVMGGVVGAGAGAMVGQKTAARRGEYNERLTTIDNSIRAEKTKIAGLEAEVSSIESSMLSRERRIESLQAKAARGESVVNETNQMLEQISQDIENRTELVLSIKTRKKVIEKEIQEVERDIVSATDNKEAFIERKSELADQRDKLVVSLNTLNGVETELENQRLTLSERFGNRGTG